MIITRRRYELLFLMIMLLLSLSSAEMKAKWTPADEEGSGPLPQSMKKRQRLLQLEKVIAESPDPAATLKKVADSMNIKPHVLKKMLKRNAADMASTGGQVDQRRRGTGGLRRKFAIVLGTGIVAASVNHFL